MATKSTNILGEFSRNADGKFFIRFFDDAAYVRSDIIIFDRKDFSVHAVLHESSHLVGYLGDDLARSIKDNDEVILVAPHSRGTLKLTTTVSVSA